MGDLRRCEGKTLMYAARTLGFCPKCWRVYILRDEDDLVGVCVAEDYELSHILREHPELKHCRVIATEEYYGIRLLRVRERR